MAEEALSIPDRKFCKIFRAKLYEIKLPYSAASSQAYLYMH